MTPYCFPEWLHQSAFPQTVHRGSPFSTSLLTIVIDLLMIAILTGVRWYFIVVLISVSLMISDIEHLFICLWTEEVNTHCSEEDPQDGLFSQFCPLLGIRGFPPWWPSVPGPSSCFVHVCLTTYRKLTSGTLCAWIDYGNKWQGKCNIIATQNEELTRTLKNSACI